MITYEDLLKGHILDVGDSLEIDSCKYQVDTNSGYYLMGLNCSNFEIFRAGHLNNMSERYDWAREFGEMVGYPACNFPELRTLEQLTKFVIDIYKRVYELRGISSPSVKSKSKSITISLPKGNKTLTHIKL